MTIVWMRNIIWNNNDEELKKELTDPSIQHIYYRYLFIKNNTLSNNDAIGIFIKRFPNIKTLKCQELNLIKKRIKTNFILKRTIEEELYKMTTEEGRELIFEKINFLIKTARESI